jgi:hypothetical protein
MKKPKPDPNSEPDKVTPRKPIFGPVPKVLDISKQLREEALWDREDRLTRKPLLPENPPK